MSEYILLYCLKNFLGTPLRKTNVPEQLYTFYLLLMNISVDSQSNEILRFGRDQLKNYNQHTSTVVKITVI